MKDLIEALNRADELDNIEDQASDFYHRAEQELKKHFNCTGAYLEPSTQNGVGRTFLFADDMSFDGSFDFETGENYIFDDDFDGFLALCKRSFTPTKDEVNEGIFDKFKKKKLAQEPAKEEPKQEEPKKEEDAFTTYTYEEWIQALEYGHKYYAEDGPEAGRMKLWSKAIDISASENLARDVIACMDDWMKSKGNNNFPHKSYAKHLKEAAFSGGMAGDNSASGGTIRGRGASTQPSKKNYLGRLKNKNPDLVEIVTVKGKDIKPGMITQAGQVKEAEVKKNNRGETKVYIMHTNNYDGFWGVDEDMEVLADPDNKSKPFAGDYRALLKMGLQESRGRGKSLTCKHHRSLQEEVALPSNVKAYALENLSANGISYLEFLGKDAPNQQFVLDNYYYQPTSSGKRLVMIIKIDGGEEYLVVMDDGRYMDILYQGRERWATYIFDTMKEHLRDLVDVNSFISAMTSASSPVSELEQQIALNDVNDIAEYMIDGINDYPEDWRQDRDRDSVVASILAELKDTRYGYYKDSEFDLTDETLNTVANKVCDLIMPTIEAL